MIPVKLYARRVLIVTCVTMLIGCNTEGEEAVLAEVVQCQEPRPEMCTQQYDPVCATLDSGVRCVTTPCDSTETATYSNGCMACADPAVFHYVAGACPQ